MTLKEEVNEKEKYWPQILAVVIGCIPHITDGLLNAWTSQFLIKIVNDKENYDISENEASYFATIPYIAMMASCFIFSLLLDRIGRKKTLMLSAIPQVIAPIIKAVAKDIYLFYLSRVFIGIGTACIFMSLPLYTGEVCSPRVRGITGSLLTSLNFFGQFLVNVIGNYCSVQVTSYIILPFPFVFLALSFFMPESPYYYILKGDELNAKNSMRKLTGKADIDKEYLKLKADVDRQISERGTWKDLFLINSNRRAISIATFLRFSQMMSGLGVYATSIKYIFEKSGGSITSDVASMISSFLIFFSMFLSGQIADKLGRRKAYMISNFFNGILLLLGAVYFYLDKFRPDIDISNFLWFPFTSVVLSIIIASCGPGIVPTLMNVELYSTSIKAKANTVNTFFFAMMMFLSNIIFYQVNVVTGLSGPFLIFGCCGLVSVVITYFYLPETRGKTLEEIQQMLKANQLH